MSRVNLEITPSNVTSSGKVSFKSGNPTLQFIIGEQDRMIIGESIRLVGQFSVFKTTGTSASEGDTIRMSEALGMYSVIDNLTIKSQSTHQTIESIDNYGRFMGSYLPATSSLNDGLGHFNETALVKPAFLSHQIGVVNIPTAETTASHFCIHLPCGLFNGKVPIPLQRHGDGGLGGLLVEIQLAPDSNVLFTDNAGTSISDAFYEMKNLSLVCEAIDVDKSLPPSNSYEFNSISSYFTTFNSANAIVNFNLGLSRVLGAFGNIVPASQINSRLHNGLANHYPTNADGSIAPIRQIFFTRGGEKFPIEYNIDTIQRDTATNTTGDPQIVRNYLNAIQKFSAIRRTSMNPLNSKYASSTLAVTSNKIDGGSVAGIGVAYDVISGDGVSFAGVNFGINMDLGLTSDSPQALYLFIHSKQTLAFSESGIQVVK